MGQLRRKVHNYTILVLIKVWGYGYRDAFAYG